MRVLGDRVLVALPPVVDEIQTASGIVLVKDPDRFQTPTRGIVVALGERPRVLNLDDVREAVASERRDWMQAALKYAAPTYEEVLSDVDAAISRLAPAPFDVQIDDCVLFPASAGEEIEEDGIRYVILRESEIIGIVEPKASAA